MTEPTAPAAETRPSAPPSDRVRLARLAFDAALATAGVDAGTDGPVRMWVTVDQGQRYPGVTASVTADGTHEVALHLVVDPVPLHPLAAAIRSRAEADVAAAGLAGQLGSIDIAFEDLASPRPPAQAPPGGSPS